MFLIPVAYNRLSIITILLLKMQGIVHILVRMKKSSHVDNIGMLQKSFYTSVQNLVRSDTYRALTEDNISAINKYSATKLLL